MHCGLWWSLLGLGRSGSRIRRCRKLLQGVADVFYSVLALAAPEILNLVEPMSAASCCWDAVFEFRSSGMPGCSGVAIRD